MFFTSLARGGSLFHPEPIWGSGLMVEWMRVEGFGFSDLHMLHIAGKAGLHLTHNSFRVHGLGVGNLKGLGRTNSRVFHVASEPGRHCIQLGSRASGLEI
jgi:hypothetical protein